MSEVTRDGGQFIVDATVLASAFDLSPEETRARMQGGQIASLCEAGQDADAGRWRLTFRHRDRALRLTVDAGGRVLSRSTFALGPPKGDPRARSQTLPDSAVPTGQKDS